MGGAQIAHRARFWFSRCAVSDCGASPPPQSAGALGARLTSRAGPLQPTGPVLLSHFSKLIDSTDPADCLVSPQARLRHSPLPGSRLASSERPRRFPTFGKHVVWINVGSKHDGSCWVKNMMFLDLPQNAMFFGLPPQNTVFHLSQARA